MRTEKPRAPAPLDVDDPAPLREQLQDVLRREIIAARKEGRQLPSVRQLAERYGVGKTTVADAVAALKREGLLATRGRKGVYVADNPQRGSGRIGVLFESGEAGAPVQGIYFEMFRGVVEAALAAGMEATSAAEPASRDCAGLIYLIGSLPRPEVAARADAAGLPMVVVDEALPAHDAVLMDNISGGEGAMRQLVALGHRRIAFINGSSRSLSARERLAAYRSALEDAGLPYDRQLVREAGAFEGAARAAMRDLLPLRPTAVFCFCHPQALGAIEALQEAGLRCPQDVSVVGFGEPRRFGADGRTLGGVIVDFPEMGRAALRRLLQRIDDPSLPPQKILIPTRVIAGDTVDAPPSPAP